MLSPQERLPYSAMIDRPAPTLPGGARLALWLVVNVEHYEYQPPRQPDRDPWPLRPHPDVVNYARRDYGNRVGLWRMLDLLAELEASATISLNAAVLDHYPDVVEALAARSDDVMAHGLYNTRYAAGLEPDEERRFIDDVRSTVRARLGREVAGWLGPALTTTPATFDLLAEAGIGYVGDLLHDDEPTPVVVESGSMVALPYSIHLNDSPLIGRSQHSGATFVRLICEQFEELYAEALERPRIMAVCLHPYAINVPSRHAQLREVLADILGHPGVITATGEQLAQHARASWTEDAR